MDVTRSARRPAGLQLLVALLLLLLFVLLTVVQYQTAQVRSTASRELLAELAEATFVEEAELPADVQWPQWFGPRRDGVAFGPEPRPWPENGPERLWQADLGKAYSAAVVAGGRVYTMQRRNEREEIVCLDPASGKEVWLQGYDCSFKAPLQYGNQPRSTPAVFDARLYTVGAGGRFQCRRTEDGELLWEHDLLTEYSAPTQTWGVAFSPLVEGDLVIAVPGGPMASIVAFDRLSGKEVWRSLGEPAGYSSPLAVTCAAERLVLMLTGKSLVGLTAATGQPRFRFPWDTSHQVNAATPLAFTTRAQGRERVYVFISSGYDKGCALVHLRTGDSGKIDAEGVFENNQLCCHYSTPVRYQDHVYGFNESKLTCMDLRTGEVRWKQLGFKKGSLLRSGSLLVVLGEEGNLGLVAATPEGYRKQAESWVARGHKCWTAPALANGCLYIRSEGRAESDPLLCLRLP